MSPAFAAFVAVLTVLGWGGGELIGHGVNRYLTRRSVKRWLRAERDWKRFDERRPDPPPPPRGPKRDGVLAQSVIARRVDGLTGDYIETVQVRRPSRGVTPGLNARGITGWG